MTRRKDRDVPVPVPEHATREDGKIQVWQLATGKAEWVTVPEAVAGMIAWAREAHGEATPGFAAVVQQALALAAEHGYQLTNGKMTKTGEQGND